MEYMTVERAANKLHMEKAEFIGAVIEHNIWIGTILGHNKIRFFEGRKLQPLLTSIDTTVSIEELHPLYVEYPDPDLGYMPRYEYLGLQPSEISLNNIRIPYKELDKITPAEAPANKDIARSKPAWKPWGDHPVFVILSSIGIIIGIIVTIIGLLPKTPGNTSKNGVAVGRDIRDSTIMLNNPDQEKAISKIQDKIRPSMIFDQKETILDDNGASDYIEDIDVQPKNISGYDIIQSIVIYPKMYLETIPLLEPQPNASYAITSEERGKKFEIIYNLKEVGFVRTEPNPKFRLEIRNPPLINGRK